MTLSLVLRGGLIASALLLAACSGRSGSDAMNEAENAADLSRTIVPIPQDEPAANIVNEAAPEPDNKVVEAPVPDEQQIQEDAEASGMTTLDPPIEETAVTPANESAPAEVQ